LSREAGRNWAEPNEFTGVVREAEQGRQIYDNLGLKTLATMVSRQLRILGCAMRPGGECVCSFVCQRPRVVRMSVCQPASGEGIPYGDCVWCGQHGFDRGHDAPVGEHPDLTLGELSLHFVSDWQRRDPRGNAPGVAAQLARCL
jgi:hypothetical protein